MLVFKRYIMKMETPLFTQMNIHVGIFSSGRLPGIPWMPSASDPLAKFENLSFEKFKTYVMYPDLMDIEVLDDIVCNHPYIVDLFHPDNIIVHNGDKFAKLSSHPEFDKAQGLYPGEFWMAVGESWIK